MTVEEALSEPCVGVEVISVVVCPPRVVGDRLTVGWKEEGKLPSPFGFDPPVGEGLRDPFGLAVVDANPLELTDGDRVSVSIGASVCVGLGALSLSDGAIVGYKGSDPIEETGA